MNKPRLSKTATVMAMLHILLIALLVYEVIFLFDIYKVWKERAAIPSGVKTSRINFDFYTKAETRYTEGAKAEVPIIPIGDPFHNFNPDPES